MAIIFNKVGQNNEIQILGDIGESWFGEGITANSIADDINQLTGDVSVLISSPGGSLWDGLAIHDMLKMYNRGNVTTKIIGATASAAAVIALGGNKVEMSDNALLLFHKASMLVGGNSDDLKKTADDLIIHDGRIANIMAKKSGKRASQALSLMEEERWMTASEAKEWGLVDKIFKGESVKNQIEKINNSNIYPKIINKMPENTHEGLFEKIQNLFSKSESEKDSQIANLTTEVANKDTALTEKETEIENLKSQLAEKEKAITDLTTEKDAMKVSNEKLLSELGRKNITVKIENGTDPVITQRGEFKVPELLKPAFDKLQNKTKK